MTLADAHPQKGFRGLFVVKLILTAGVVGLIAWSLQRPDAGILKELLIAGPWGAAAVAAVFLTGVFFYCRDLEAVLHAVPTRSRAASPRSVWYMFLIPYNFVEDFFIVWNISQSLAAEAEHQPALRGAGRFGLVSGFGWCALQIVSLIPTELGSIGGFAALPLWLWHWRYMRRMRRQLRLSHPTPDS